MPPPPLTDEEVRQCILAWWEGEYVKLGIDYEVEGLPDNSAPKETWLAVTPTIYRMEWERAYRYGLADDAHAAILAKLEAPLNPETQLAQVLDWEDEPRLRRAIEEMCEIDDVNYWAIRTQTLFLKRNDLGYRFLLLFVAVSLMAAWLTQDIKWLLGTLCCYLILWRFREHPLQIGRATSKYQIHPYFTFIQLAENINDIARSRAEEMLQAAQSIRQKE